MRDIELLIARDGTREAYKVSGWRAWLRMARTTGERTGVRIAQAALHAPRRCFADEIFAVQPSAGMLESKKVVMPWEKHWPQTPSSGAIGVLVLEGTRVRLDAPMFVTSKAIDAGVMGSDVRPGHYIEHRPGQQFGLVLANIHDAAHQRVNGVPLCEGEALGMIATVDGVRVLSSVLIIPGNSASEVEGFDRLQPQNPVPISSR